MWRDRDLDEEIVEADREIAERIISPPSAPSALRTAEEALGRPGPGGNLIGESPESAQVDAFPSRKTDVPFGDGTPIPRLESAVLPAVPGVLCALGGE